MILDEEAYLEHYGVPGMKWGVRKGRDDGMISRRKAFKEVKGIKKTYEPGAKEARKDPTFKREVKATKKGKGIKGKNLDFELSPGGELLTGRVMGQFKNSKGEKVSEDFANAVLNKVTDRSELKRKAASGAIFAVVLLSSAQTLRR